MSNMVFYIRYSVYRECPKDEWKINSRTINDNEFVLITVGNGTVTIEGKQYEAKPGIMFYFYPGLVHSLQSNKENPLSFAAIHFSLASISYDTNMWRIEKEITQLPLPPVMSLKNHLFFSDIMKKLNEHWNRKDTDSELICNGLFSQLLYYIYRDFKHNSSGYASRKRIEEAASFIQNNLDKKISVKEIASRMNISADYFSSIFKSYTGYTVIQYINKCRIDKAKKLLTEENAKMKEIAAKVGFCDEFYFSRVFKKMEGISPAQFKAHFK